MNDTPVPTPGPSERFGHWLDAILGRARPMLSPLLKLLLIFAIGFGGGIVGSQMPGCSIHWPPPGPGPGPGPDPGPKPDPAPIPEAGFRVLIVYESAELSKLPAAQQSVLYSKAVRDYLNSKCVMGPDNKTREWRLWDKDVDTTNETAVWQAAMKRPRASVPWIVVSDGKTGHEGPLPANVDDMLTLLKKYGGQ